MQNPGVTNFGSKYEEVVSGYFALKLLQDETVRSFKLQINSERYKKFDDLIVKIEYENGHDDYFAIQLKHREREGGRYASKAIDAFTERSSKFYIEKYRNAYHRLSKKSQQRYKFILFTNCKFQDIDQVEQYEIRNVDNPLNRNIFESNNVYRFRTRDGNSDGFFNNFFLFSEQKDYHETRQSIVDIYKTDFFSDETDGTQYLSFFSDLRDLRGKDYDNCEITRDALILKLESLLLKNFIIRAPLAEERSNKIELVEKALKQFDLTFLQNTDENVITDFWRYSPPGESSEEILEQLQRYKLVSRKNSLTDDEQRLLFLCHFKQVPIFVHFDDLNRKIINKIVHLCRTLEEIKLKFILVGPLLENEYIGLKIFQTLSDIINKQIYQEIIDIFKISLQGRHPRTVATLKKYYNLDLDKLISPDDVFKWFESDIILFGKEITELPQPHIERDLIKMKFSCHLLEKLCEDKTTIIHCNDNNLQSFKRFLMDQSMNFAIIDTKDFKQDPSKYEKSFLVLTDKNVSTEYNFCHYLKLAVTGDSYMLEWLTNKVNPKDPQLFENQINALCDGPGYGKTTMMKFLATNCPPNYWTVTVSLKQVETFFEQNLNVNEIFEVFLREDRCIDQKIFQHFKSLNNIVFFLDGLDEIKKDCLSGVVNCVKILVKEGYKIWISATIVMRSILEKKLKIYSIFFIEQLTMQHQIPYVREKLNNMSEECVNRIVTTLFEKKHVYTGILQVPLYLYIVTEVLRQKKEPYVLENLLTLTNIYSCFVEGKIQHYLDKSNNNEDNYRKTMFELLSIWYMGECKTAALKSCLEPKTFELFKLNSNKLFLNSVRKNGDCFGLIIKVNEDNTVVFNHNSFAHFFAAICLVENFNNLPADNRRLIFHPNFSDIRNFFDSKLAENHPLHLAVLNQNLDEVQRLAPKHLNDVDEGGRNPLHLASSLGRYHPVLKGKGVYQKMKKLENKICSKQEEIFNYLVNIQDNEVLNKDELFGWNCFEYANAAGCLYSLEKLLEKNLLVENFFNNLNLFTACYYSLTFGYIEIFKKLVQDFGWLKIKNQLEDDVCFLHIALENGHEDFGRYLIELGVDLSKTDNQKRTALHAAASFGHCKVTDILLHENMDKEARDVAGKTPLQFAAQNGHLKIVDLLLKNGADPNTKDFPHERIPLHKAAYTGKTEIVEYLVNLEIVDVNTLDKHGKNALDRAAEMGHYDTVKFLVENGIEINVTDKNGRTSLHYAALEGHTKIVQHLLKHKAHVLVKDDFGNTARKLATSRRHVDIVQILEKAEKDSELIDSFEESLIHKAARNNDLDTIKKLVNEGANIGETNKGKRDTILHVAAFEGHADQVVYLLRIGANTAATNIHGRVPLHLAAVRGHADVIKLLLNTDQDNFPDKYGISPLQKAAYEGHIEVVKAFSSAGISINTVSAEGGTAFHSAVRGGHIQFIEWLLNHGADMRIKNKNGKTSLHVAAERGNLEVVGLLISKVEDMIDETAVHGRTALHLAAAKGYKKIVECLVTAGADVNKMDSDNKTAIDIASSISGREEIVEYLHCYST